MQTLEKIEDIVDKFRDDLISEIDERDQIIEELKNQIEDKDEEINDLNDNISELEIELRNYEHAEEDNL